jgi:ATP-binding cassette subfamily B protein
MRSVVRYLKPFLFGFVSAVLILFAQAITDLTLPNYMSDIVNVGIQQSGVEHAAPVALSGQGMELMHLFMDDGQRALADSSYRLVSVDDGTYASQYPGAASDFYVLEDGADRDALDSAFGVATWTMIESLKSMGTVDGAEMDMTGSDMDVSELYAALPLLASISPETVAAARTKALSNSDSMLLQSGILLSRLFLQELGVDLAQVQSSYILSVGMRMLLVALIGGICGIVISYLASRIAAGIARDLRRDVFAKIESFSSNEFDRFSTASLITRCTNDITQIQQFFMMGIRMVFFAPLMGIGGVVMALDKSVSMSWIIAVACLVIVGMLMVIMSIVMPRFKAIQKLVDRLNLVARENLTGLMVIRAFGTQRYEKERFSAANKDLTDTMLFVNRVMAFLMPMMNLVMNGVSIIIIWVGARQIASSALQVGDMMAFMQYALQIIMSFLMVSFLFILAPRAAVSVTRLAEILDTEISILDPEEPVPFDDTKRGLVEFRDVSFRYHGAEENALEGISFVAMPGETTAIIGSTGSGKSTIANLVMRFYDVSEGSILVDGVDIRNVRQHDLRARIGYVPQKGVLLSGTIASNLRYGKHDADDGEVETAASVAQAMEFIENKPEKFESPISQGGSNVSGGQKQRLSIARALIRNPEIFIFDDSFSALDFKTDRKLRNALEHHTGSSTVLLVAQRVSTIKEARQIIVLDEGKIVGKGTHAQLLATCPQYYEIASSQLSEEELA